MLRRIRLRLAALPATCLALAAGAPHGTAADDLPAQVSYSRDIRPILSANCFKCHGPDEKAREADFRLDRPQQALADRGGYFGLVPGKPDESEVHRRLIAESDDERMPPPKSKKKLTSREIAMVRRWIEQGAKYEPHWAFVPPQRPALPASRSPPEDPGAPGGVDRGWARNAIDRFILARLEAERLRPSPEADRYTLIRRVTLDLTGVPPSPAEIDRFVADDDPLAYERLVDGLLGSPHYGERWARKWLDLARYADTNGYEKDRTRSIWPYRDWVIDALNADLPFDRFTVEQIAGDMLPDATPAQRIATGFHRNTMLNEEGGIDPQEFRFQAMVDRVGTTGAVWLGLTVGCAQCHTHKYDPLTHGEYYGLFALLNNADEPEVRVANDEIARRREEQRKEVNRLEATLAERFPLQEVNPEDASVPEADRRRRHVEEKHAAWLREAEAQAVAWKPLIPGEVESNLPTMSVLDDGSVLAGGDQTKNDVFSVTYDVGNATVTAIRLEALPHESLPANGPGRRIVGQGNSAGVGDFFLSEIKVATFEQAATGTTEPRNMELQDASESFAAADRSAAATIDGKSDTGWAVAGRPGEPHWAVYRLKEPLVATGRTRLQVTLQHESFYPAGIGRFRVSITADPREIKASPAQADLEPVLLKKEDERTPEERDRLRRLYLSIAPELADERKKVAEARSKIPELPTTLVMQERPARATRVTHRHHRGEFLKAEEPVAPAVPEWLHPLSAGVGANRLEFARWLVDERNPLVARVTMNRQWAAFFGRGLVRTTEDFGFQGELPTHPQLLDWLATEFVHQRWSMKAMHRLIVTSATYRQSSAVTPEILALDPKNELLARSPRVRLDAEAIRDDVLAAAGLLSRKTGGPSVYPPQPASVVATAYGGATWAVSPGEDRYRRGLYTFSKRTAPYAMFTLFDAPSGEACVPRRIVSNTPLQALTLLNDAVFVEASQALARRVLREAGAAPQERVRLAFLLTVNRPPAAEEQSAVLTFLDRQRGRFASGADPMAIVTIGDGAPPSEFDLNELAAWTIVARSLMNLDEAVMRP